MNDAVRLEHYKQAEKRIAAEEARRGIIAHTAISVIVSAVLICVNVIVIGGFMWFPFPVVGMGIGVAMHYLFGYRWLGRRIADRQTRIERYAKAA